jgi:hypothetical protein
LIYLSQGDVRSALDRVAQERPPRWREHVGAYTNRGAWAQATGHTGFDGFVTWLQVQQSVELSFVAESGLARLLVDVTGQDWDGYQRQVAAFLKETLIDQDVSACTSIDL